MSAGAAPHLCAVAWRGRTVRIEHQWIAPERSDAPLMVFLHEGLGSVSMWRDFPARLCDALGWRGLVYSRPGYGRSTPRAPDEHWAPDFMHQQALEVLPALFEAMGIDSLQQPPWLFGHSDGGSIALIHAANFPQRVAGCIVVAPHILVEDISVRSIEAARLAFEQGDLRTRLARHHDDPDSAFRGWNDVWLSPAFRPWSLASELARLTGRVLAVQGENDEYGTLEQIRGIARAAPQTELLALPDCGHSPHRDQPQALIDAVRRFAHPG
jgi:pimeloyl-ACP methyl ester carboxylesterase